MTTPSLPDFPSRASLERKAGRYRRENKDYSASNAAEQRRREQAQAERAAIRRQLRKEH